jgi:predicted transcriptional regulator of viral defense system
MPSTRRILYALAEERSGWLRASDAIVHGVSRQQLARYADSGVLQRSSHGVYRLRDFPAQPFEDVIEACLWASPEAVSSYDSALSVYSLGDAMPAWIHLTVPGRLRKHRPGVIVHVEPLPPTDVTSRDGVPVTSVARTLRDIAGDAPGNVVASLINEAEARGLLGHRAAAALHVELGTPA